MKRKKKKQTVAKDGYSNERLCLEGSVSQAPLPGSTGKAAQAVPEGWVLTLTCRNWARNFLLIEKKKSKQKFQKTVPYTTHKLNLTMLLLFFKAAASEETVHEHK